jgi:hypothetical protein
MNASMNASMNATLKPRVFRFSVLSLALLAGLLLVGWWLTDWAMNVADLHSAIEVDG